MPGPLTDFEAADVHGKEAMFNQGGIPTCREGLTLAPNSFCLADGTTVSQEGLGLRAPYVVANLPGGSALLLYGAVRVQEEGDMRLGWITVEKRGADRVITHLETPPARVTPITAATGIAAATGEPASTVAGTPGDGSEIDLMVVYTPLAKHLVGGRAAMEALVKLYVAEANQAYANSGVIHRIRLVLTREVEYTGAGITDTDLSRIGGDSDGYMDHVHELRDLYAADLVHLLTGRSPAAQADQSGAFGVTDLAPGTSASFHKGLLFTHELGHNMGLYHDRYELEYTGTASNLGYVNQRMFEPGAPGSASWKTIMAYSRQCRHFDDRSCPSIPYFSNPDLTYKGDSLGVSSESTSTGVDGPADAVGALNARRETTANFRRSSLSPTPRVNLALSQYWLVESGGVTTVTATLHRPSRADTVVTITASPNDRVSLSENRTLVVPAGRRTSTGVVTITGVDNAEQTGDVMVTVSATAVNTSDLGVIAPEQIVLAIADDETTPVVTLSLWRTEVSEGDHWFDLRIPVAVSLDNRSSEVTQVDVSWSPYDAVSGVRDDRLTLTIPAGQTASLGRFEVDVREDSVHTGAEQIVTVSGTATNPHGVTGPESVTLTIIDDGIPLFAGESAAYMFRAGIAGSRNLPEAEHGNGTLAYSLSPAPGNGVTFIPGPPARIEVAATAIPSDETTHTLTVTDVDGDTDTMTVSIRVLEGGCSNSAAVSGYAGPGIVADCEALLASSSALGGAGILNWSEDLQMSQWQGVSIADNRVVELHLPSLGLSRFLPSELGKLASLQWLDLTSNQLTGEIPADLGDLANLQWLYLSRNQLIGEIPADLGDLANLKALRLGANRLTGPIPEELGNLYELFALGLSGNKLTGPIPVALGRLEELELLFLGDNDLTGPIPMELGRLDELESLSLGGNQLTGCIPTGLLSYEKRGINLDHDLHTLGLPDCDEPLTFMEDGVAYTFTAGVAGSRDLLGADYGSGILTYSLSPAPGNGVTFVPGPPPSIGVLATATPSEETTYTLTVTDGDGDTDTMTVSIRVIQPACHNSAAVSGRAGPGIVSDCEALLASRDALRGAGMLDWSEDLPISQWQGVSIADNRVVGISIPSGGLSGFLPSELSGLASLQSLDLSDNDLKGEIPGELGNLANLISLNLSVNRLTGEIPTELGKLAGLQSLNLAENKLIGGIPGELGNLVKLQELSLEINRLTGEVPAELATLAKLRRLYLDYNQLTGPIPRELGNLTNLRSLGLEVNQLTGPIPKELGNLSSLRSLRLAHNQLTGEIPKELGNLSHLRGLRLNDNQLTGPIPMELTSLSELRYLFLTHNRLTGCIPAGLRDVADSTPRNDPDNDLADLHLPDCG